MEEPIRQLVEDWGAWTRLPSEGDWESPEAAEAEEARLVDMQRPMVMEGGGYWLRWTPNV